MQGSLNKDGNREKRGPHRLRRPSTQCVKVRSALSHGVIQAIIKVSKRFQTFGISRFPIWSLKTQVRWALIKCCYQKTNEPFFRAATTGEDEYFNKNAYFLLHEISRIYNKTHDLGPMQAPLNLQNCGGQSDSGTYARKLENVLSRRD